MKRIALVAAAAAVLAAPSVFAQASITPTARDVIDHGGVVVSPPVQRSVLPTLVLAPSAGTVVAASDTAVMGAGPGTVVGNQIILPGTAILDVPRHAVHNPEFQKWLRWERSRIVGPAEM